MLDYQDALELAEKELAALPALSEGDGLMLLLEHTIEKPFGWVFFYTSRLYYETGDFAYALAGNAPFIINRHSGEVFTTGTARPVEEYVAEYEAQQPG